MGMYTEFIFGCSLKKDTPKICIDALDTVINYNKAPKYENPTDYIEKRYNDRYIEISSSKEDIQDFIESYNLEKLCWSSSYYFGAANPVSKFYFDPISNLYHISIRSDLKDYKNEIEEFIDYITPYVEYGSGLLNLFAYVQYEEDKFPTLYGINGTYTWQQPENKLNT